jgi:hypothetical protein
VSKPAFYEDLGDGRFRSTEHTVGPWSADFQHGGPPSALLTRALEHCEPSDGMRLARVTVEILGPVPVTELTVSARVSRPGRSVTFLEASASAGGREVLRASGWRIRADAGRAPEIAPSHQPPQLPEHESRAVFDEAVGPFGYGDAIEWRFAEGALDQLGPARCWTRLRGAVVAGEEPTGWQRVMSVADSGNGVSGSLPIAEWMFINPDLTVALHREAVGDWVCLEAATSITTDGVGLAASELSDAGGWLGRGLQTLLVSPR